MSCNQYWYFYLNRSKAARYPKWMNDGERMRDGDLLDCRRRLIQIPRLVCLWTIGWWGGWMNNNNNSNQSSSSTLLLGIYFEYLLPASAWSWTHREGRRRRCHWMEGSRKNCVIRAWPLSRYVCDPRELYDYIITRTRSTDCDRSFVVAGRLELKLDYKCVRAPTTIEEHTSSHMEWNEGRERIVGGR